MPSLQSADGQRVSEQVGFGDISAANNIERVFCIFTMWVGTGVFAVILNGLQQISQEINEKNREKQLYLQTVSRAKGGGAAGVGMDERIRFLPYCRVLGIASVEQVVFELCMGQW